MKKLNVIIEDVERELKDLEQELELLKWLKAEIHELYGKGTINLETLWGMGIYYKDKTDETNDKIDETNDKLNKLRPIAKVANACESGIVKVVKFFTDDID